MGKLEIPQYCIKLHKLRVEMLQIYSLLAAINEIIIGALFIPQSAEKWSVFWMMSAGNAASREGLDDNHCRQSCLSLAGSEKGQRPVMLGA